MTRAARPVALLVWVTVLSLPFFVLGAVSPTVRLGAVDVPASAVMFVVPVLAAVMLTWRDSGRAGVAVLLRRVVDRPAARARWYLLALALPVAVGVLAWAIARVAGWTESGLPISPTALSGWWAAVVVVVAGAAVVFAAACEELGWTAYATDPLQQRWGALGASLALGLYWAVWHLIPLIQAGHGAAWIAGWFVGTVAARVIIVALHNVTAGASAAILLHAMLNVVAGMTPDYEKPVLPLLSGTVTAVVAVVVAGRGMGRRI